MRLPLSLSLEDKMTLAFIQPAAPQFSGQALFNRQLSRVSLGVAALILVGLVGPCFAQQPGTVERRLPSNPLPIPTGPERSLLPAPTGPCSGGGHFIVGPGLGRTETTSPTISWALDRSAARNVCSVEIEVQPGIYGDPLTITRDTTITNSPPAEHPVVTGSITSYGHNDS